MVNHTIVFTILLALSALVEHWGFRDSLSYAAFQQTTRSTDQRVAAKQLADSLVKVGTRLADTLGSPGEAIAIFDSAGHLYAQLYEDSTYADVLQKLGFSYRAIDQYDSAIVQHRRSLDIWQKVGDDESVAQCLNNIGELYQYMSEYEKAIVCLRSSLEIVTRLRDDEGRGVLLTNIAVDQAYLGQYDSSMHNHEAALIFHRKVSNEEGIASTLVGMGYDLYHLKQYSAAEKLLNDGLEKLKSLGLERERAASTGTLALVYSAQGRKTLALATAARANSIAEKAGDRLDKGASLYRMGMIQISMHRYQDALRSLDDAEIVFRQLRLEERVGMVRAEQMKAYKGLKKLPPAILSGKEAINAFQNTRAKIKNLDKQTQKDFLSTKEEAYRELGALLIDIGRLAEAEIVLNMLKEDEYFDFLRGPPVGADSVQVPLTTTESRIAQQRSRELDGILAATSTRSALLSRAARSPLTAREQDILKELDRKIRGAKEKLQRFLDGLPMQTADAKATEQIVAMRSSYSIQQVLKDLGGETVAVYTLLTSSTYYAILVTANARREFHRPIRQAKLNHDIEEFRKAVSNPQFNPRPSGKKLYDQLVLPLEKALRTAGAKTIMWNLHGTLRYIPFSALFDGRNYLVERYRQTRFTLSSIGRLNNAPQRVQRVLGLGVSHAHEGFRELPFVPKELGNIVRAATQGNDHGVLPGVIRLDNDFTFDTLQVNLRRRFPIVHIATHFEFTGDEASSFLLLGDGGKLTLERLRYGIDDLFSGVELLTLSACNTAIGGSDGGGRELESFAELAQNLGAGAVLASLWPVFDASTSMLMGQYYRIREVQPRRSKAEALQSAQAALLEGKNIGAEPLDSLFATRSGSDGTQQTPALFFALDRTKPFAHPFYWAPFVLIGNWR